MVKVPALALDFLMHIVNVQWEGGLAVEFFDKAGPPADSTPEPVESEMAQPRQQKRPRVR